MGNEKQIEKSHFSGQLLTLGQNQLRSELRKLYDLNVADEKMILDGCLKNTKILVMLDTAVSTKNTLEAIAEWVKEGGILIANCHPFDESYHRVPELRQYLA